jgi:Calx-beta domain
VLHDQVGGSGNGGVLINPRLGALRANGGPTLTMAWLCGSPAIDAGDDTITGPPLNLTTDQRGRPRPAGAHVDIGAFELQPDDEQCRDLSISDAAVVEGAGGTTNIIFNVTLSAATVSVPVNGDTLFEPDETFTVTLSNPTNAVLARAQAVGTIINDDEQPTLQFSDVSYQVSESATSAVLTVVRTGRHERRTDD